jgi:5-methylcytosine-specific restriction endonuclease McrA
LNTLVDKYTCYFCGVQEPFQAPSINKKYRRLVEVHHIKEKNEGGSNDDYNLVPVCSNCHSKIHIGLINPQKWLFTTSGWKLSWKDNAGKEHLGKMFI